MQVLDHILKMLMQGIESVHVLDFITSNFILGGYNHTLEHKFLEDVSAALFIPLNFFENSIIHMLSSIIYAL